MSLRRSVIVAGFVSCLLVGAGGVLVSEQRARMLEQEVQSSSLRRAVLAWDAVLGRLVADLQRGFIDEIGFERNFPTAPTEMLERLSAAEEGLRRRGAVALQILAANQPVPLSTAQSIVTEPLLDASLVGELVLLRRPLAGLVLRDGNLLLTLALPAPTSVDAPASILVIGRRVADLLPLLRAETGLIFALTDIEGNNLEVPPMSREWSATLGRLIPEAGRRNLIAVGDRAIAVLDLPLNDLAGSRIGFRRWMSDDTDLEFRKAIGRLIGNALLVLLLLIVALGFAFWIRLIFRGLESALEGLQALARGDTAVQIEYAGQRDEVGASAQALRVFRQSQITLQSSASRAERRRRHQARFIEAQLDRLSATLGPKGREAMQEEIRRAGNLSGAREDALDSLAVALRVMVDHITAQQEALQRALAEQDVALQARARMQALEQEISVVSKMQARLTPSAMPSAQHVAVRSHLFQGHEFGGDFLDFFWLDDSERRLAVFIGSVDGQGLPAALLAVSARALVRALTAEAATPGACLSRVSDLLVGESTAEMALNMTLAVLDVSANLMIVARAGMPPPIAVGRLGDARLLSVESAPPLALRHGTRVPDTTIDLPERTLLVLFSQGMTSFEENGLPLGAEGVRALVEQAPDLDVDPVTDFLSNRLEPSRHNFRGDASFIALRLLG